MIRGVFITGTDTGVGKTIIAAAIARVLSRSGVNVGVMKPIETGCPKVKGRLLPQDGLLLRNACFQGLASSPHRGRTPHRGFDPASLPLAGVAPLAGAAPLANHCDPISWITPYRYHTPLAPMAAATLEKKPLHPEKIMAAYQNLMQRHAFMVVEGVGGLMVPLTKNFYLLDLIRRMGLPVILVARSRLGSLNHTLLSLRYGAGEGLNFLGLIVNYMDRHKTLADRTYSKTVSKLTRVPLIASIPFLDSTVDEERIERASTLLMRSSLLWESLIGKTP